MFVYKLFDKRDAFPFFVVRMPYIDSNILKSIFYSTLASEFLRIAFSSLLYKELMKKLWNCLIEESTWGYNPTGVEKHYPKSFEHMKKRLPNLEKL